MKRLITITLEGSNVEPDLRIMQKAIGEGWQRMNGSDTYVHTTDGENGSQMQTTLRRLKLWSSGLKPQGRHKERKKGWLGQVLESDIVKTAKKQISEGLSWSD